MIGFKAAGHHCDIIFNIVLFLQDLAFVDTLINLTGVIIECLDFSIPGLFVMATTAAGKSPNTTPTKWTKRLQKPMGNFTSLVHVTAKLLSACERTSNCKVSESSHCSFITWKKVNFHPNPNVSYEPTCEYEKLLILDSALDLQTLPTTGHFIPLTPTPCVQIPTLPSLQYHPHG